MKPALCKRCGTEFDPGDDRCPSCLHRRVPEVPLPPIPRAWWLLLLVPVAIIAASVRVLTRPPPTPVRPHVLVEPTVRVGALTPEPASVTRRWTVDAAGQAHLELVTDAEPYERAVRLVKAELMEVLPELASRADVSAEVTLQLPGRFRDGGLVQETETEAVQLNALLSRSKRHTRTGEPVRVVFSWAH